MFGFSSLESFLMFILLVITATTIVDMIGRYLKGKRAMDEWENRHGS